MKQLEVPKDCEEPGKPPFSRSFRNERRSRNRQISTEN